MGPSRHGWMILGGCMALGAGGLAVARAETGTGPQVISATVPRVASEVERSRGGATRYQHDDGDFRQGKSAADSWVAEYAVRYVLRSGGAIRWLEACFSLYDIAAVQDYAFDFVVYSDETRTIWNEGSQQYDRGSRPGDVLSGPRTLRVLLPFPSETEEFTCVQQAVDVPVSAGSIWVSVRMPGGSKRRQMRISGATLGYDLYRYARVEDPHWRERYFYSEQSVMRATERWQPSYQRRAISKPESRDYAIRMGVVHEGGPSLPGGLLPGMYSECHPTTTPLVFDGDYKVSLCYEAAGGEAGEAKGGIWASGQSGLLWFFDRGNAEVLVKVLDGCSHNDRRWVFVAPVTDVAFNLHVTDSRGLLWTHRNRLGVTAETRADTSAFPCE